MLEILINFAALAAAVAGGSAVTAAVLDRVVGIDQDAIEEFRSHGLADGGRYIGYVERFLFYVLIVQGGYTAVGFVLALKGILRHREIAGENAQKVAEYVLVGTMTSLAWTFAVAIAARWLIGDCCG